MHAAFTNDLHLYKHIAIGKEGTKNWKITKITKILGVICFQINPIYS